MASSHGTFKFASWRPDSKLCVSEFVLKTLEKALLTPSFAYSFALDITGPLWGDVISHAQQTRQSSKLRASLVQEL